MNVYNYNKEEKERLCKEFKKSCTNNRFEVLVDKAINELIGTELNETMVTKELIMETLRFANEFDMNFYDPRCYRFNNENIEVGLLYQTQKGYGFVNDVFVLKNRVVGHYQWDEILTAVVGGIKKTDKGYKASWLVSIYDIDDKTMSLLLPEVKEELKKYISRVFLKKQQENEEQKRFIELTEKLVNECGMSFEDLYIDGTIKVKRLKYNVSNKYGGRIDALWSFDKPIDKDLFKKFLEIMGLKLVAKECDLPIVPESISYYLNLSRTQGSYFYRGEWDD